MALAKDVNRCRSVPATKGITVYRYGSKGQQVLSIGNGQSPEQHEHFARCDPYACKL